MPNTLNAQSNQQFAADPHSLLGARVRIPQHVVYRTFPSETVVLNLHTGRYHGLNVTAGKMLDALEAAGSVREAVGTLTNEFRLDPALVRRDVCALCRDLLQRGLVELDAPVR
jgi:Coenzyme PQQ synthesis protein D (PqqD)